MKSLKRPRENSARMPGNSTSPTPRGFEGNSNSPYGPGAWGQSDPMDRNQELPLLRIHVLSAKGLPRSSGAVGMPDPYVVVKFNQEKVGETKVDHKTRRPEWKEHFLIRSDLAEPDPPPEDDDASNADDDEPYNATSASPGTTCIAATEQRQSGASYWVGAGEGRQPCSCANCRRNRKRGVEVQLEVWHRYGRSEEGEEGGSRQGSVRRKRSSGAGRGHEGGFGHRDGGWDKCGSKPDDLYDDRLFDVSFVARRFQRRALQRVHTAVAGRNKLIGVCRITSAQLRSLGSSTLPADLALRDPKGSWLWGRRGTIRVAVSLERLQVNIVKASLRPNKAPIGVPLGAGVGAGGVARTAQKEAAGEDVPPAELSCKVLWNDQDFSSPSCWDQGFCITQGNNQLWLDVRRSNAPRLTSSRNLPASAAEGKEDQLHGTRQREPFPGTAVFKDARRSRRATTGAVEGADAHEGKPTGTKDTREPLAGTAVDAAMDTDSQEQQLQPQQKLQHQKRQQRHYQLRGTEDMFVGGSGGRGDVVGDAGRRESCSVSAALLNVTRIGGGGGVRCGEEVAPADATRPPFSSSRARSDVTSTGGMQSNSNDHTLTTGSRSNMSPEDPPETVGNPTTDPHFPSGGALETLVSPAAASPNMSPPSLPPLRQDDLCPASRALDEPFSGGGREGGAATAAAVSVATAAAAAAVFAVATAGAGAGALAAATAAGAAATAAGATAAVASASRSGERDAVVVGEPVGKGGAVVKKGQSPVAAIAAAVVATGTSAARTIRTLQRKPTEEKECWTWDRSCVLKIGRGFTLSTFDAQGVADMLNSSEESIERMANTKEWHEMGFRVHWDPVKRRFTILNVSRASFVLRGSCSSMATELLGFGERDYTSVPVAEALLDPQHPSDPPRRHMAVVGECIPPPLVRPQWMRTVWGPPAMEIFRGGELQVQVWARQPAGAITRSLQRRRRRRSAIGKMGQTDDGSWLVGTALLDAAEVCRLATGKSAKLPLLSPAALSKRERLKSPSAPQSHATIAPSDLGTGTSTVTTLSTLWGGLLPWWFKTPATIIARQRAKWKRLKRRIALQVAVDKSTPLGTGGAYVWWGFHPRCRRVGLVRRSMDLGLEPSAFGSPVPHSRGSGSLSSRTSGSKTIKGAVAGILAEGGRGRDGRFGSPRGKTEAQRAVVTPERGQGVAAGDGLSGPVAAAGDKSTGLGSEGVQAEGSGAVGHVWMSLKLRDPSILLMRVVRQWNMARDEASVQQRRVAQAEAKRLWMLMPGISLWRVLVHLIGMSLLVSYCVTLTLRAYHSTSCRATFGCEEETDPKLASFREWQTLVDNLLSAVSFLDMLLQFRTAYVDNKTKIITSPKKVAQRYLRTWFIPDLWCSLPYSTMQPLLQPVLDEVEDAADSLSSAQAHHTASYALSESLIKGADSPLSLWVFKLSRRLHIGKINNIRGTRAFKYLDDSAMGIHFTVKQVVDVVRGRRKVLVWMGKPPKQRGWLGKFFFRIGVTNKWTRIVLSYRLLGYAKAIGTLVRAMRVLAVAIRAVPRAARVLRLVAVFLRSYEGRRRSKDLHEASIVIQRRAGRHMALKVAGRMQATYRRRTRAASESALSDITSKTTTPGNADTSGNASISPRSDIPRARQASTPARPPSLELNAPALDNTSPFSSSSREGTAGGMVAFVGAAAAAAAAAASRGDLSPVDRQRRSRRGPSTPPPHRSPFSFSSSDVKRGVLDREGSGGYWAEGKGRGQREGGDADGKSSMLPRDSMGVSTSPVTDVRSEEWLDLGEDNSDIDDLAAQPCSGVALVGNAPDDGSPSLPMADKPEMGIWPSSLTSRWRRRRLDSLLNPALPVSPGIVLPPERTQKASCVADPSCAGSEEFDAVAGGARSRRAVRGSGAARRDDVADVAANAGQEESELQLRDEWGSERRASFSVGVWDYRKAISGAKKSVNTRRLSGSDRLYR